MVFINGGDTFIKKTVVTHFDIYFASVPMLLFTNYPTV